MSSADLTLLYRGPLSSCNYECWYCPFWKQRDSERELREDRLALERFIEWCTGFSHRRLRVLFTPWGEALIHPWYQAAFASLTRLPHLAKVAIQTNLSCELDWVSRCEIGRMGIWATYHPTQTDLPAFLKRCHELRGLGVSFSVGAVGVREAFDAIETLRASLPRDVYVWVNAFKGSPDYYRGDEIARLTAVDPLFPVSAIDHRSQGARCRTGHSVVSVDGEGRVRRCHFVPDVLGSIYDPAFERALREQPCPNETCDCHIGYVHLERLGLYERFGDGLLERALSL